MHSKLADYLKDNSTIITPSRRLASHLLNQANSYYAKNERSWSTPKIFALSDWLEAIWQQLEIQGVLDKHLLDPSQSLLVWTAIIRSFAISKKLLNVSVTAKMAAQAWGLLQQWRVIHSWHEQPLTLDQETFKTFANAYEEWLINNNALDSYELATAISPYFANDYQSAWDRVSKVKIVVMYGFEEISPQIKQFIDSLQSHLWHVEFIEPIKKLPTVLGRKEYYDQEQELLAAANFAKASQMAGKKNIGIVVPDLANQRSLVDKIFKETFQPLAICSPEVQVCESYNISAAIPLDHYPIIHSAFLLLKMINGTFSLNEYFLIINAPFFAWGENELTAILQHYEQLKIQNQTTLTLEKIIKSLHETVLRDIFARLVSLASSTSKKMRYALFATYFQQLLTISGWPGKRALNSVEHQAVARWAQALAELRLADTALEAATFKEALSVLRGIVSQIPFQAQNKSANVQILGVLEALGLHFDSLWVVGLHAESWPPLAKPNPFIPLPLQRQLKMPHASSEREMEYAKTMTMRLVASADEVILSHPKKEKAKSLELSELIRHIPLLDDTWGVDLIIKGSLENRFAKPPMTTRVYDEMIPLQVTEKVAITSHLLTLQSACPFKAFAELRLQAKRIEVEDDWLAPHQQGIILHEVLQHFWENVRSQKALLDMDEHKVEELVTTLIDKALQKHIKLKTPLHYLTVEKSRLVLILQDYLAIEKSRSPFKVIATESSKSYHLLDIEFHIRLDRIDQTEDGQIFLLDYKTGQFNINEIWGMRPKAPQLPLYYLAAFADAPQALLVAKLNRQALGYEGISHHAVGIEGVIQPKYHAWDELKEVWTASLGGLMTSFLNGDTTVSPLDSTTCRYCDLGPLCRITEVVLDDN
jgi:ATP-dependent helicase/nuclease subunit B